MRTTVILGAALGLAGPFAARAPAQADGQSGPRPVPVAMEVSEEATSVPVWAAVGIARIAQLDIHLSQSPIERDFWVAGELLDIAHKAAPDDIEILRLLIEARSGAGQSDEVKALSRVLLKLDPADTVNTLRVLSYTVAEKQSVEERVQLLEELIGPKGAPIIDASVRSRLAVDAALLAREQGDMDRFARLISHASELDSTNKEAATLALTYFSERIDSTRGRVELLINVLKADPFDPAVHLAIARELGRSGAFKGAARFYSLHRAFANLRGERVADDVVSEAEVAEWLVMGAESYVDNINRSVEAAREEILQRRTALQRAAADPNADLPPDAVAEQNLPDPQEARLTLDAERVRLLASAALGKSELIDYAVQEMMETVRRTELAVLSANKPEGDAAPRIDEATAREIARVLKQESVWMRLWAGRDLSGASRDFAELKQNPNTDPRDIARIDAWFKLRYGEVDEAEKSFKEQGDEALVLVGLAIVAEMRGNRDDAVAQYMAVASRVPGSPAGAFATTRAGVLLAQDGRRLPGPGEEAQSLEAIAASVPNWLENMLQNPREFMTLRAELPGRSDGRVGPFEKSVVRVRLRNTSRLPLAVGPDKPLNSRLMLVPDIRVDGQTAWLPGMHSVASLERRLRLMPREELVVDVWPDNGLWGTVLTTNLAKSASASWRLLQGFRLVDGIYEEGPLCLTNAVGTANRPAMQVALLPVDDLVKRVQTGTTHDVVTVMLSMRDRLSRPEESRMSPEDAGRLLEAFLSRYPRLNKTGKLLLLSAAPVATSIGAIKPLDDMALRDTDEDIVRFVLLARIGDPAAEALADTRWQAIPSLADAARIARERLTDGTRTYARPLLPEDVLRDEFGDPLGGGAAAPVSGVQTPLNGR